MKQLLAVFLFLLFATTIQAEEYKLKGDTKWYVTVEKGIESDLNYGYIGNSTPVFNNFATVNWSATYGLFTNTGQKMDFSSQTLGASKTFNDNWSAYVSNDLDSNFKRVETWMGVTYSW